MPAPKKTTSPKPAAKRTAAAASSGAKATATSTRKAAGRTATQAKSGATKTANTAKAGATKTKRAARRGGAAAAAKSTGSAATGTAKSVRAGAKGTATAASAGAKQTRTTAKRAATTTSDSFTSMAEQLAKGTLKPSDVVMLTRDRIQEALDEAAARGRVTRKDANDLVTELVKRGRHSGDEMRAEFDGLIERGRSHLDAASKRARRTPGADTLVRGADRARRSVGVGPSFPILGYDDLNAAQVQKRLSDLSKPELRKVLTYERKNANRKSVTGALEKAIG